MNKRLDDPVAARHAGADWLSLALMDARNHTLRWLAAFEAAPSGLAAATALAGHGGWWMERWIVRNVQAQRGPGCDPTRPRLASIDPGADSCFGPAGSGASLERVRAYLAETLEMALELLSTAVADDTGLYFHRLALLHEDRTVEALAALAQAAGLVDAPWPALRRTIQREALWLPAQTFDLGSAPGGLVPAPERWAHPVALPEFEIDAQAVSWARFLEFAEDGGYDDPAWWDSAGWAWAQDAQRRAPRHVEQLHQGVVLQRQGRLQRAASGQAAVHITRHEAQAWCRWAGRRLPTEVEWELAACTAAARGFVWGEVLEWTGGSARGWPGHTALPGDLDPLPAAGGAVLRGACHATPGRAAHPKARRIVAADEDTLFCGFRSCAL